MFEESSTMNLIELRQQAAEIIAARGEEETRSMHDIRIQSARNGVIVQVGCQTFVSNDIDKTCREVARYLKEPEEVEKEYAEKYPRPLGLTVAEDVSMPAAVRRGADTSAETNGGG
jgi:hypothetical protein